MHNDGIKECLECTLPICDDRSKECRYVQIVPLRAKAAEAARKYRRESREKRLAVERRYREKHRDEINARRRAKRLQMRSAN